MMNVPEQLQTAQEQLEATQNKQLVLDQNYDRIKKLHDSEKSEIRALQDVKSTLEASIEELSLTKNSLTEDVTHLNADKESLKENIETSRQNFIKINTDITSALEVHKSTASALENKSNELDAREKDISEREEVVNNSETSVLEKHAKIKKFVESI